MILVCSKKDDVSAQKITDMLRPKTEVFHLYLEDYLSYSPELSFGDTEFRSIIGQDLFSVSALYYRVLAFPHLPNSEMPDMYRRFLRRELITLFLGQLMLLSAQKVVNHPFFAHLASFKTVQLKRAKSIGFSIPDTCITTDRKKLFEFYKSKKQAGLDVVTKAIHVGYIQAENPADDEAIFTQDVKIDTIEEIPEHTPILFQEKIVGGQEIRCFVIDNDVFAARVETHQTDYRLQDGSTLKAEMTELPAAVKSMCIRLTRSFNLHYGAIDFIQKGDASYFLDFNATGDWLWYQNHADLSIGESIVRCLTAK